MIIQFNEVLNDLYSYFLLADVAVLRHYQQQNHLSNDLAHEFTTTHYGDEVVTNGTMIALADIENYPYTIVFNLDDTPVVLQENNEPMLRENGYLIHIQSGRLTLFTWRVLQNFDDKMINDIANHKSYPRPSIDLDNGWYQIDVLAGMIDDKRTFEFLIKPTNEPTCTADVFRSFSF